ncbi:hypothetical protein HPP92_019585 [Vanilla planifolia]|uniref:K Homology domain-containing protein n=1 Tax=Vanilla planifolia TaxID=51239 RepID=A0A835Q770_VANPL|nr:hypothetical protein HPP92_019585 [Vanilla planifolia]
MLPSTTATPSGSISSGFSNPIVPLQSNTAWLLSYNRKDFNDAEAKRARVENVGEADDFSSRGFGFVGVIIGKSGENIKYLQVQSGARIEVNRAEQLINDVLTAARSANAGDSGFISAQAFTNTPTCDDSKVGLIIGKGGEKIKSMQTISGACVQVSYVDVL